MKTRVTKIDLWNNEFIVSIDLYCNKTEAEKRVCELNNENLKNKDFRYYWKVND